MRAPTRARFGIDRWRTAIVLVALSIGGCAQGGVGSGVDGGNGGRSDGGRRDAGRHDSGPAGCSERGYAASCMDATDLGTLAPGDRIESMEGLVPPRAAQWVRIGFPAAPPPTTIDGGVASMAGGGAPTLRFLRNDGDVYRFEVRTMCVGVASCGGADEGMATNITEWSFADDPTMSMEGDGQFSTRNTPWPESIYVRIFPTSDPGCGVYQLEVTR